MIETGCAHADDIVEAYRRYAVDVEVHFADANGEFAEDDPRTEMERVADEEAEASRQAIALENEVVENEDGEVMFDPNVVVSDEQAEATLASSQLDEDAGATHEEEHTDQNAATDTVVSEADGGDGEAPVDPASDGGDAGTEDVGGEAGTEEPTDQS